jgi:hypothetical protein
MDSIPQARPVNKPRKPRKPPEPVTGNAVWVTPLDIEHGCPGQVILATDKLAARYTVQVLRSCGCKHFGSQIVGFRLTNEASGAVYDIDTTPVWGWTCDCPDAVWRDTAALTPKAARCKHVVLLRQALDQLPAPAQSDAIPAA